MDLFTQPAIKTLKPESDWIKTQGTGAPTNPNLDCGSVSCSPQQGDDFFNLTASWNDNSGSNVNDYIIRVLIEGGAFDLRDEDAIGGSSGCNVTESPAGFYTLQCTQFPIPGDPCDCFTTVDFELVSVTDPDGNALGVTSESCPFDVICGG
jgi:hypothetical protein